MPNKFKKPKLLLITALMMILISIAVSVYANSSTVEWNGKGNIEAIGYGYPPANSISGHAKILARRAAIVDAYRNLGETVAGVSIDATTTVSSLQVESDIVKTKVNTIIRNARIVKESFNTDGSYQVVMSIPMFGENSLASAVIQDVSASSGKLPFPSPLITPSDNSMQSNRTTSIYTGVIIDCTGLAEINRVMSPVILNEKREPIYGHQFLDSNFVVNYGMADYVTDKTTSAARAGSNPLILKAIALEKHNSAPVLSQSDSDLLLSHNQGDQGFLRQTAVVFKQGEVISNG